MDRSDIRKYKSLKKKAEKCIKHNKIGEGIALYLEAFEIYVVVSDYLRLAQIYISSGKFKEAIEIHNNILSQRNDDEIPKRDKFYYQLAVAYDMLYDNDHALACYEKALRYGCDLPELYAVLGMMYFEKGTGCDSDSERDIYFDKSIELLEKIKSEADDLACFAYSTIGEIHYYRGEYNESLKLLLKAIDLDRKKETDSYFALGNTYAALGEFTLAEMYYLKELKRKGFEKKTYYNLGLLYKNIKDYDKSILNYQKALKIDREDYDAWFNLACSYSLKGDFEGAYNCLNYIKYKKPEYMKSVYEDEELAEFRKSEKYQTLIN